ncbi:MAG: hypothetical protein ACKO9H_03265, partial [Planctomycetota bacterium]
MVEFTAGSRLGATGRRKEPLVLPAAESKSGIEGAALGDEEVTGNVGAENGAPSVCLAGVLRRSLT